MRAASVATAGPNFITTQDAQRGLDTDDECLGHPLPRPWHLSPSTTETIHKCLKVGIAQFQIRQAVNAEAGHLPRLIWPELESASIQG